MIWITDFVNFRRGAYNPRTQVGISKVTVPEGSATSNMPERASRMEFTKSCVAAVLSTEGANCSDWMRGTRRMSSVWYSVCIRATKYARNQGVAEALEVSEELSSYREWSSVGAGA